MIRLLAAGAAAGAAALLWVRDPDAVSIAIRDHPLAGRLATRTAAWQRWDQLVATADRNADLRVLGLTAHQHRARQLRVLVAATAVAAVVLLVTGVTAAALLQAATLVAGAGIAVELSVRRRATRRRALLGRQVVLLAEYLALGATAGLTAADALSRCLPLLPTEIAVALTPVTGQIRAGAPLAQALPAVSGCLGVPELDRLSDTVVGAAERGTPLAATLLAQADDIRARRRALDLITAGRAEIAMLVPIITLVLPAVVVVAVYPGFVALLQL